MCISVYHVCDNITHCDDGSDEWKFCSCYKQRKGVCLDTGDCIENHVVCDGRKDCGDGSDELFCDRKFRTTTDFIYASSWSSSSEATSNAIYTHNQNAVDYSTSNSQSTADVMKDSPTPTETTSTTPTTIDVTSTTPATIETTVLTTEYISVGYPDFPMEFLTSKNPKFKGLKSLAQVVDVRLRVYPKFQGVEKGQDAVLQCRDEGFERSEVYWRRLDGKKLPSSSKQVSFVSFVLFIFLLQFCFY